MPAPDLTEGEPILLPYADNLSIAGTRAARVSEALAGAIAGLTSGPYRPRSLTDLPSDRVFGGRGLWRRRRSARVHPTNGAPDRGLPLAFSASSRTRLASGASSGPCGRSCHAIPASPQCPARLVLLRGWGPKSAGPPLVHRRSRSGMAGRTAPVLPRGY